MKRSFRFSLPVTVVISAICYIYASTVFVFVDQWFGMRSAPGIMNAAAFTAVALMSTVNYAFAVFTDPGRIPVTFMPDIEDADNPIHEIKRKGGDLRYCQKCSHYKPPRAHHCRVCKRCVLRMDHHCIWMNNCVGHANYKAFFIFVLYAVIACIYSLVISGLLLVPLSVALGVLLGWQSYLILQNKTTIEYHEGVRAMWLADKGGDVYSHPYNVGAYENLTLALGPNILCWLFPTSRHIGSGLRFPTAYEKLASASTSK